MSSRFWSTTMGTLWLAIVLGSSCARDAPVPNAAGEPQVALPTKVALMGRVEDSRGNDAANVTVMALPERGGLATRTATGRDGVYRFEELPAGTYRVDFEPGFFEVVRRNHVRVRPDEATTVDAALTVGAICECIYLGLSAAPQPLAGLVVDESGAPLPHARLEVFTTGGRYVNYTDREGRFLIRVPADGSWQLAVSDSGFATVNQQLSPASTEPVVVKLPFVGTQNVPTTSGSAPTIASVPENCFLHGQLANPPSAARARTVVMPLFEGPDPLVPE